MNTRPEYVDRLTSTLVAPRSLLLAIAIVPVTGAVCHAASGFDHSREVRE